MVQEQRLEQQRREMEEHARQIKLNQEQELQRATSVRRSHEQHQAAVLLLPQLLLNAINGYML